MPLAPRRRQENDPATAYHSLGVGTQRTHAVQFYEDDQFLIASVGDFLASGLAIGQRVLAVATAMHGASLRAHLERRGFDVERAMLRGQLTIADADEVLATFMADALPERRRFRTAMARLFRTMDARTGHRSVRVFGEMVDVLCRKGNVTGAIRLEELWNELAGKECFSLLCAYSMSSFSDEDHAKSVAMICGEHAHVIPTEHYMQVESDARLREVAMLQQRAHALATEIERRKELEQSLRTALERAESASRAKSDFLAMMSHELRTPLNAIGGHVQLVEMELHGPINDRQRDALDRVQRSQRHLLALINDVLNLVRAESAAVEFQMEPIALLPFLSEVTELLGPLFTSADIGLEVRAVSGESLSALADREKVHQIVLNLLGNALKFTPAGGTVSIDVGNSDNSGSVVRIDVRDTGVGIPTDKLERIFQPFVQLGTSASEQRRGIGLGLSISRALARGMGGDLTASRGSDCGSILSLTLPRA